MHRTQSVFVLERPKPLWQSQGAGCLLAILIVGLCFQGYAWVAGEASSEVTYTPVQGHFLGRNLKVRHLEQQVTDQENEIRYLQYQISKATLNTKLRDSTMEAADNMLKTLQEREEKERLARRAAERILENKCVEVLTCNGERGKIETKIAACTTELDIMTTQLRNGQPVVGSAAPRRVAGVSSQPQARARQVLPDAGRRWAA